MPLKNVRHAAMALEACLVHEYLSSVVSTLSVTPSATLSTPTTEMIISLAILLPPLQIVRASPSVVLTKLALGGSNTTFEMHTVLAASTVRTKPCQVELAKFSPHMSLVASWALLAEASIVVVA